VSYQTYKNWYYQLQGRYIHLWQLANNAFIDTLGGYKIRLPGERSSIQLIYPNEDITDGLRIEYTSFNESEIFISEALETTSARASSSSFVFNDSPYISKSSGYWATNGFAAGDKIRVIGSSSNDNDYTIDSFFGTGDLNLVTSEALTTEAAGESITIYQIPKTGATADETAHVNLNRMLCLAVVDYVKAQQKDGQGDIQAKEYYMKQFWKKVADDQSNKRNISMTFPIPVYSVK
tara:strand:+ start:2111 stop:2815 length:705 start_codon:yes stop_codon:yes gene_type:complete